MKKIALIGIAAAAALLVGCSSTQCRDGSCDGKTVCTDKENCTGDCDGKCAGKECETACNHANSTFECPNPDCSADKPCCANCAQKYKDMCPDCKGKSAMGCPDCKDGQQCAKCAA